MIEVDGVTKTYRDLRRGEFHAVEGVSFHCRAGEAFGLLGPNGAGKTTTMRMLSTVVRPTAGRVRVAGFDAATDPAEVRRRLGFLSANTGLYERMTAGEHVAYFGRLYGLEGVALEERVAALFADFDMEEFRPVAVGKLSTGTRQKVSIARALVHDPPVLVFDEPTLGLDVLVAQTVLKTVGRLRDAGKCVLYSTHILREVEKLCDRVAIMYRGRILEQGTLAEIRLRHRTTDLEDIFFKLIKSAHSPASVPDV